MEASVLRKSLWQYVKIPATTISQDCPSHLLPSYVLCRAPRYPRLCITFTLYPRRTNTYLRYCNYTNEIRR